MTEDVPLEMVRARGRDPLRRRHRQRHGGFRTVWLNAAGWSALVAVGLAAGAAAGLLTPLPFAIALPAGVVVTYAGLLVADHLRWRTGTIGMGYGALDAAAGAAIVAELSRMGVTARYEEIVCDEEEGVQRSIVCRNPDEEKVRAVVERTLRSSLE